MEPIAQRIAEKIELVKKQYNISNEELSKILNVTRQTASKYAKGEQLIDSAKLFKLARHINKSISFFLEDDNEVHLSFMYRADNPKNNVCPELLGYVNSRLENYYYILELAKANKVSFIPEKYHINVCNKSKLDDEDKEIIQAIADKMRQKLGIENDLNADLYSVMERNYIHVCALKLYEKFNVHIDAMSAFDDSKGAFICLNDNPAIPEERKSFSIAHEFGHLIFHREQYKPSCDNLYINHRHNINEKIANHFASCFLIPRKKLKESMVGFRTTKYFSLYELMELKKEFGVSAHAMLLALKDEKYISSTTYGYIYKQLKSFGYEKKEPSPIPYIEKNKKFKYLIKTLFIQEQITLNKVTESLELNSMDSRKLAKDWLTIDRQG